MKVGDDTMPSLLELKRPNMSRWQFTFDGQTAVQAYDGKTGWMWMPFAGMTEPQAMSSEEKLEAEQQADIDGPLVDYKAKGSKIELVGARRQVPSGRLEAEGHVEDPARSATSTSTRRPTCRRRPS